jgi:cation transport regulator ChaB
MPWKTNEDLVKSVKSVKALPKPAISLFREVANRQLKKGDSEATALKIAWGVVKKRFKQVDGKWVAKTDAFREITYYEFSAKPAEEFITRSENGVDYHNYILTDIWADSAGTAPTEDLIKKWASWINETQPEVDTDHELFERARRTYGDDVNKVSKIMQAKKGIARAMSAVVDKGRLIVSLAFDKRYKNYVDKIKGLSIEAAATRDKLTNKFVSGDLLGFTFAVNANPVNKRSVRV